jgi:hypothetical protein
LEKRVVALLVLVDSGYSGVDFVHCVIDASSGIVRLAIFVVKLRDFDVRLKQLQYNKTCNIEDMLFFTEAPKTCLLN